MGRLIVALSVSLWIIPVSILVNRIVPHPYMDEIFHIPQAQQYCKGNFRSWDPMITTPPGLYLLSLPYVASLFPGLCMIQKALAFSDVCSTAILRSINCALAVICSVIIYGILKHLRPALGEQKRTVYAIILALYPLHWFFTYLYYTDVASLTTVLAMYMMCLKKNYRLSALLGVVAVAIRQTNVVWVVFTACTGIINVVLANQIKVTKDHSTSSDKSSQTTTNKHGEEVSNLRRRKSHKMTNSTKQSDSTKVGILGSDFTDEVKILLLTSWRLKWEILVSFSPFVLVLLAFLAFVRWNGSIVLGAKDAHTASLHFPQILYFGLVSALQAIPLIFTRNRVAELVESFRKSVLINAFITILLLTSGVLAVHFLALLIHISLLIIGIIHSIFGGGSLMHTGKTQSRLWILAYFIATAAVLVPAPLIEFRYYTIPFYIFMLHTYESSYISWILIGIGYAAIDIFTMWMFLFRPFSWDHEDGTQRFIW